jgi:hypothetical protein
VSKLFFWEKFPPRLEMTTDKNNFILSPKVSTYLLHKGTFSTVHHENVRRRPGLHDTILLFTLGVSLGSVHHGVTELRVGIVHLLRNRTSVRRISKESFTVGVSIIPVKTVGDL